jgi:hypothetical protein
MKIRSSKEFTPPLGFLRRVRSALEWIDITDLEGIECVFLFEEVPPVTPGKNPEIEVAIRDGLLLFSAYNARQLDDPAHILLITRDLCAPIPRSLQHSPAFTVWIAKNIAHEVGHHLIAERRARLRPKADGSGTEDEEEFAERYAESIITDMQNHCLYRVGKLLLSISAEINYYKGVRAWRKRKYQIAADYFYMATQLKQDHEEASYWFWKAKERVATEPA